MAWVPSQLQAVTFDSHDAAGVAAYWAELLGRDVVPETGGALVPGDDTQVGLRFVAGRDGAVRTATCTST